MEKDKPIHPGEILRLDFMEPLNISSEALAKALGHISPTLIDFILDGSVIISVPTALKLGRYFGVSPTIWLNLQTQYSQIVLEKELESIQPHPLNDNGELVPIKKDER